MCGAEIVEVAIQRFDRIRFIWSRQLAHTARPLRGTTSHVWTSLGRARLAQRGPGRTHAASPRVDSGGSPRRQAAPSTCPPKFASILGTTDMSMFLAGTDLFDGVQSEASGEHAQLGEQSLFLRAEQVVRPPHEILHGAMSRDHRRLGTGKKIEAPVETVSERRRRSWPVMRAAASSIASGSPSRWRTILMTSSTLSGPSEKPGRAAMARWTKRRAAGASDADRRTGALIGDRERSDGHTCSPGSPSTSRLVARMVTSGHQLRMRSESDAIVAPEMLTVVEDEKRPAASQVLDQGLLNRKMLALLHIDRSGDRGRRSMWGRAPAPARRGTPRLRVRPTARLRAVSQAASCRLPLGQSG